MKKLAFAIIANVALCHTATFARAADTHEPLTPILANNSRDKLDGPRTHTPFLVPRLALANETAPATAPSPNVAPNRKSNEEQHLTESWWFWGAVAGVVVTTVAIVLVAGRPLEKPDSDLGDMRAFRQ